MITGPYICSGYTGPIEQPEYNVAKCQQCCHTKLRQITRLQI